MSDVIAMQDSGAFEALLASVLRERCAAEAPAGLEQRLLARFAQEAETRQAAEPSGNGRLVAAERPFAFAECIAVRRSAASTWIAVGAHVAALLLLFALAARHIQLTAPAKQLAVASALVPPPPAAPRPDRMSGGGGRPDLAPAARGHLPRLARKQIVPPMAPPMLAPKIAVQPSVVVQPDLKLADNKLPNIGAPDSSLKGFSMGSGLGTGLGSGLGAGIGAGAGGNNGGGVMHIGGSVHAPVLLHEVDPEFSEEARKAKFSGNVEVYLIVDEHGNPTHVRVARGVGMGLDEKAVAAVRQYKFKPAMQNGKPVKVDLYVDVNFQIF